MHTLRNRILFFGAALMAGLGSMWLHRTMMTACIDENGLLISGSLPERLLWGLGITFLVFLLAFLQTIGGDGSYAGNFPRSIFHGCLMIAAGVILLFSIPELDLGDGAPLPAVNGLFPLIRQATSAAMVYLPWAAAACMAALGVYRILGKRPRSILCGIICLFYTLMLVNNYRLWSANPALHCYAYQLLSLVLLMLCAFHRTCCDAGIIQRKKLLATGFSAAACAMAALSMDFQWYFFLASAVWALGSIGTVAVLPPDSENEEPEQTKSNE